MRNYRSRAQQKYHSGQLKKKKGEIREVENRSCTSLSISYAVDNY